MNNTAIRAESLSKYYHLGKRQERYRTLRDTLVDAATYPLRRVSQLLHSSSGEGSGHEETVWALSDISFSISRGEVVGIIGRNGAGKSTLLKILSRITEPSGGHAEIYGRVGSLLEVGTGFHPELTGLENIYLNGAILGMKRKEIDRKFDEITAFAEVDKFINTPVKHYSSGMYLRLAFAVAAHMEPEILLVDEVLAVGDARFQKKCLNKMHDVRKEGRTVIFVSHNMPAITRICERVILLDGGKVLMDGPAHKVVSAYLNSGLGTSSERTWPDLSKAPGDEIVRLRAVRVKNEDGQITDTADIRRPVGIEIEYEVSVPDQQLWAGFTLHNEDGVFLFSAIEQDPCWRNRPRPTGRYSSTGWIPGNLLAEGTMIIAATVGNVRLDKLHMHERDAVAFQVVDSLDGDSARGDFAKHLPGVIRPMLKWKTDLHRNGTKAATI